MSLGLRMGAPQQKHHGLFVLRHRSVESLLVLSGGFVGLAGSLVELSLVLLVALRLLLDESLVGLRVLAVDLLDLVVEALLGGRVLGALLAHLVEV